MEKKRSIIQWFCARWVLLLAMSCSGMVANADTIPVTSTTGGLGVNGLRWAVDQANAIAGGPHVIDMTSLRGTIELGGEPSPLNKSVTVQGPGADKLTIESLGGVRVFGSLGGTDLNLRDLHLKSVASPVVQNGGAVAAVGDLDMRRCFVEDYEGSTGGAVHCLGSLVLQGCVFSGNRATIDGGAVAVDGLATVRNCTFADNAAGRFGGGLAVLGNSLSIIDHCTFYANSARFGSAAIDSVGTLTQLADSIASKNRMGDSTSTDVQLGFRVIVGSGNFIGGDPQLYPLRHYDEPLPYFLPRLSSPVLDAAGTGVGTDDARGNSRPYGVARDCGAIEVKIAKVQTGGAAGGQELDAAIQASNQPGDRTDFISIEVPGAGAASLQPTGELTTMTRGSIIVGSPGDAISGSQANRILTIAAGAAGGFDKMILREGEAGAGFGGAVNVAGRCYLENCQLEDNQAACGGAVLVDVGGVLEVERCYFYSNTASQGDSGAVEVRSTAAAAFRNTTLRHNRAIKRGGAISSFSGDLTVTHCTFGDNIAGDVSGGGGVYVLNSFGGIYNCYFGHNLAGALDFSHIDGDGTLSEAGNVKTGDQITDLRTFSSACVPILYPRPDSPARDAGSTLRMLEYDVQMSRRPAYGLPDAGAVEYFENGYEAWASRHFKDSEICAPHSEFESWGPFADANDDGMSNLMACVFQQSPWGGASGLAGGSYPLPKFSKGAIHGPGQEYVYLEYYLNPAVLGNPLRVEGQRTTSLASAWTAGFTETLSTTNEAIHKRTRTHDPVSAWKQQFVRLEISGMPRLNPVFVGVGDPGNGDSPSLQLGGVAYGYSIMKYELSVRQWVEFLNGADPDGDNSLDFWAGVQHPINRDLSRPFGQKYVAAPFAVYSPITHINFYDACRFCNWLNNGAVPGANTESGAYTLTGGTPVPTNAGAVTRNPGAKFAVPSLDEWYKAGHYPGSAVYTLYPTGGATANNMQSPGDASSMWYDQNSINAVGSYNDAKSPWGAHDMGGNAAEWTEDKVAGEHYTPGGSWDSPQSDTRAPKAVLNLPVTETDKLGLRIVKLRPSP